MKQRNITGATLFNPRILHQSYINSATLQCDSRGEHAYLIDLEFDDTVERFMTQPNSFMYEYQGKKRRFTSDVRVLRKDGSLEDVELKDARFANSEELKAKIAHISSLLQKHQNSKLTLVTTEDIYCDPAHVTRKILYKYMFITVPDELTRLAIKALCKSQMTIAELERRFTQKGADSTKAWAFLALHYSFIDFHGNPNISFNTTINWSK